MLPLGLEQKLDQGFEVVLQAGLGERHARQLEEVILEVVQVPQDRLPVERIARIRCREIDDPPAPHLEQGQPPDHIAVHGHYGLGKRSARRRTRLVQGVEQRGVPEVLEKVDPALLVVRQDLRHGKIDGAESARKREECPILLVIRSDHSDDRIGSGAQQSAVRTI